MEEDVIDDYTRKRGKILEHIAKVSTASVGKMCRLLTRPTKIARALDSVHRLPEIIFKVISPSLIGTSRADRLRERQNIWTEETGRRSYISF
jgi:hypothetical protein